MWGVGPPLAPRPQLLGALQGAFPSFPPSFLDCFLTLRTAGSAPAASLSHHAAAAQLTALQRSNGTAEQRRACIASARHTVRTPVPGSPQLAAPQPQHEVLWVALVNATPQGAHQEHIHTAHITRPGKRLGPGPGHPTSPRGDVTSPGLAAHPRHTPRRHTRCRSHHRTPAACSTAQLPFDSGYVQMRPPAARGVSGCRLSQLTRRCLQAAAEPSVHVWLRPAVQVRLAGAPYLLRPHHPPQTRHKY